ncbi:MAG TPA: flagellar biosynthesis protein FlhF [Patescibacteria group bacterium]|nr:flagellar biosynthesis protein FlhF [Patescibacteria group bacterium]
MKVKMFTAPNINEAMAQVKQDLGRDAVILHTRRLKKGGIMGFFAKEVVEVMAALETTPAPLPVKKNAPVPVPSSEEEVAKVLEAPQDDKKIAAMETEMVQMRKMLEQLVGQMPKNEGSQSPLVEILVKNDVEASVAAGLVKGLPADATMVGGDPEVVKRLLLDRVGQYLQRVEGISVPAVGCKTVALVGPTGVGKTTTIAKLAANFAIKEGIKVAMITADTYRIAAVEQLKIYSDIIGVPIEIVYSADELKSALHRHRDKQLVLIDTAGRSPGNPQQIEELQALLAVDPTIETHLVLSVTTKYRDALEIVNKFAACSPQKFLFTKIDEAANLGTVLNLLYRFPTALSYVTTGQNVPDDIELVQSEKLATLILRDS